MFDENEAPLGFTCSQHSMKDPLYACPCKDISVLWHYIVYSTVIKNGSEYIIIMNNILFQSE